jgi:hypothetical protein
MCVKVRETPECIQTKSWRNFERSYVWYTTVYIIYKRDFLQRIFTTRGEKFTFNIDFDIVQPPANVVDYERVGNVNGT